MHARPLAVLVVSAAVAASAALAARPAEAQETWHDSLDAGLAAARRTGRPVLVLTCWTDGVCNLCDAWRTRVRKDPDVAKQLARYETVEWPYDGSGGAVVKWTLAHGGKSADPAAQLFVVGTYGTVLDRLDDAKVYTPASVADWLKREGDAWERTRPRTALQLAWADAAEPSAAADAARREGRPLLLYFARHGETEDKALRPELAAGRKFEKTVLDSKAVADAAEGWTALRFDVSVDAHRAYAASLGVEKSPALLVWDAAADAPTRLAPGVTSAELAARLKKSAPK